MELAGDPRWQLNMSVALALADMRKAIGKREANKLGIPDSAIDDIVDMLCNISRHHAIHFRLRPGTFRTPTTNSYWNSLSSPRCHFIVTHNIRDLQGAERFGIGVVTPGQFLGTMEIEP